MIRLALLGASILAAGAARAQAPAAKPTTPADRCGALVGNAFEQVPDAPTQITSASIQRYDGVPFCEVNGYIAPQIGILLRLPVEGWNGRTLLSGCGGLCGFFPIQPGTFFQIAQKRGYAVMTTDMGHHFGGAPSSGKWAYNNLMAEMDFGFGATHATNVAGKEIVAAFYGKRQDKAYYAGCSTGGRQGLVSAQRYPNDFDGLVVGGATIYYATSGFQLLWSALANRRADGSPIMTRPDVELLHAAALAACDKNDGIKDGLIGDPRQCRFDPKSLACAPGKAGACLDADKIEVARKVYQGPVDSKGRAIHTGGAPIGSELAWLGDYFDDGARKAAILPFMIDKFRYVTFSEDPGESWTVDKIDWDNDPIRAAGPGSIMTAINPDLRRIKASGAKILHYQGWADENVVPSQATDYYDMVTRTMGGTERTREFYRLFMVPGMGHCGGGAAADQVDYLTALESWVERGQAPERLVGTKTVDGTPAFSRPYFPYPDRTVYAGKGNPQTATSFRRVAGAIAPDPSRPIAPTRVGMIPRRSR